MEEIVVETNKKDKEIDYDDIDSDEAEYSSKSDFSKAKIVYEAMQKCIDARGKEMRAGYYNVKLTKEGYPIKMWVEDSRQVFIGTVEVLRGLLSPEIKNESNYKEAIKKYYEERKKIKEKYIYKEKIPKHSERGILLKESGRNFIPEIGAIVVVPKITNPQIGEQIQGGWDNFINAYWDELIVIYDYVFALLNDLINNLNYFKQAVAY